MRAIKDRQTTLTDCELTDFATRVKDTAFAVVKVHIPLSTSSSEEEQQERFYFMAIISADDTLSPLPNNDIINNNKSSLPASFQYKTLSDLYNDLANLSTITPREN
jgi:hypothetical protein